MNLQDTLEWVKAATRWVHVFAAILWVGQTYLFHFFEHNLEAEGAGPGSEGGLWLIHGGGFFRVEKQGIPQELPPTLHWFKWEAATTWLSGVLLIALTYYWGGLLVEPGKSFTWAATAGVGAVLGGWLLYDGLLRSPLGRNETLFAALGFCLVVGVAWGLGHLLSERAVFIHVGALFGTLMAANVWMRILPSQRRMIRLAREGKVVEPDLSTLGPQRSRHNTYMVVPLVFLMISNHYPTISYGHRHNWAVLAVLIAAGWGAAHLLRGRRNR